MKILLLFIILTSCVSSGVINPAPIVSHVASPPLTIGMMVGKDSNRVNYFFISSDSSKPVVKITRYLNDREKKLFYDSISMIKTASLKRQAHFDSLYKESLKTGNR